MRQIDQMTRKSRHLHDAKLAKSAVRTRPDAARGRQDPSAPAGTPPSVTRIPRPRRQAAGQSSSAALSTAPRSGATDHRAGGRWCSAAQATVNGADPASRSSRAPRFGWSR